MICCLRLPGCSELGPIMKTLSIAGYADQMSARPGDAVAFKVSCKGDAPYRARLVRSISADPNPAGQGVVEEAADAYFEPQELAAREQPFYPGSYAQSTQAVAITFPFSMSAFVFPTLAKDSPQTVLSSGPIALLLDEQGCLALEVGDTRISTGTPLKLRAWHMVSATIDDQGQATVSQAPHDARRLGQAEASGEVRVIPLSDRLRIGARLLNGAPVDHFNGKIEAPEVAGLRWDFSRDISSTVVPGSPPLELVNYPTRAVTGVEWTGAEMNWRHAPEQYGAIHFHDDDIVDFGWETDFEFRVPEKMPSGLYFMRIEAGAEYDAIPLYVMPAKGVRTARIAVLASTFTYSIYGNHARPDYAPHWQDRIKDWGAYPNNPAEWRQYGLSTYNNHSDGSGICHASHLRPLFNTRPGYLTWSTTPCSGLRHIPADSHLIAWLHAKGYAYDIVTDDALYEDGVAAVAGYDAVITGSHPEYHTSETLDALEGYRDGGGALLYLGGNGFYWRIARHSENPRVLEIRRAEAGIRAWAAEPGEYYNAFDGTYGGLWRRNGRPPQQLAGVGFTAQGNFYGAPYRRVCTDPAFDWVFEGIEGDLIGDFGFSGNGAAGFELDRVDMRLGSHDGITLLAQSVPQEEDFVLVPEEQLTHITNLQGSPEDEILRADMIWLETPSGGRVFSVGSITFCGSLPWNGFENNVSTLLGNVLGRVLKG